MKLKKQKSTEEVVELQQFITAVNGTYKPYFVLEQLKSELDVAVGIVTSPEISEFCILLLTRIEQLESSYGTYSLIQPQKKHPL